MQAARTERRGHQRNARLDAGQERCPLIFPKNLYALRLGRAALAQRELGCPCEASTAPAWRGPTRTAGDATVGLHRGSAGRRPPSETARAGLRLPRGSSGFPPPPPESRSRFLRPLRPLRPAGGRAHASPRLGGARGLGHAPRRPPRPRARGSGSPPSGPQRVGGSALPAGGAQLRLGPGGQRAQRGSLPAAAPAPPGPRVLAAISAPPDPGGGPSGLPTRIPRPPPWRSLGGQGWRLEGCRFHRETV